MSLVSILPSKLVVDGDEVETKEFLGRGWGCVGVFLADKALDVSVEGLKKVLELVGSVEGFALVVVGSEVEDGGSRVGWVRGEDMRTEVARGMGFPFVSCPSLCVYSEEGDLITREGMRALARGVLKAENFPNWRVDCFNAHVCGYGGDEGWLLSDVLDRGGWYGGDIVSIRALEGPMKGTTLNLYLNRSPPPPLTPPLTHTPSTILLPATVMASLGFGEEGGRVGVGLTEVREAGKVVVQEKEGSGEGLREYFGHDVDDKVRALLHASSLPSSSSSAAGGGGGGGGFFAALKRSNCSFRAISSPSLILLPNREESVGEERRRDGGERGWLEDLVREKGGIVGVVKVLEVEPKHATVVGPDTNVEMRKV